MTGPARRLVLACRPADPLVAAFADRLAQRGIAVTQVDDGDARALKAAAELPGVWLGGFSRGARLAAEIANAVGVGGLILLGYPFHPKGAPRERGAEVTLAQVSARSLVLQGERDAYGNRQGVGAVSPRVTIHWLTDGNHRWQPRASAAVDHMALVGEAARVAADFMTEVAAAR